MDTLVGYAEQEHSNKQLSDLTAAEFYKIFGDGKITKGRHLRLKKCPSELRGKCIFTRNAKMENFVTEQVAEHLSFLEPETVMVTH
jgi:hypothetical protein